MGMNRRRLLFAVATSLFLFACSGDSPTAPQAGPPSQVTTTAGDRQEAVVGARLPNPLTVKVADAEGRPVSGVSVTWAVTDGGGTLSSTNTTTDAQGVAKTEWTLGTEAGENKSTATVGSLSPVTFTATAKAGSIAKIEGVGGNEQTGTVGSAQADSLGVKVMDAHGNPVGGAAVTWAVVEGGGSVSPTTSTTNSVGVAKAQWTMGTAPAQNKATATVSNLSPVTFTAIANAGTVAKLEKIGGDQQSGLSGTTLSNPLVVKATDSYGNAVGGVSVTWAVTGGGGSVSPAAIQTSVEGRAETTWTLGSAGTNTVTATVDALPAVEFTATASTAVSGIINTNTTWTKAKSPYILTDTVQVAFGSTLTVEPGVAIQGGGNAIEVWGELKVVGVSSSHIKIDNTAILPKGDHMKPSEPFLIQIEFAEMRGGKFYSPGTVGYGTWILRNSTFADIASELEVKFPISDSYIERNIFINSGGIWTSTDGSRKVYIRNNSFYNQKGDSFDVFAIANRFAFDTSETVVEHNSFWSTDRVAVRLPKNFSSARLSAPNNFWNTTDEAVIQAMIFDKNDDLASGGHVEYKPFLTASHSNTPIR